MTASRLEDEPWDAMLAAADRHEALADALEADPQLLRDAYDYTDETYLRLIESTIAGLRFAAALGREKATL